MRWASGGLLLVALGASAQDVSTAGWLAGCWRADGAEPGSEEHWLQPAGGTMMGVGRTVKGGRTTTYEFMQIRADAEGRLVFMAQPAGKPPDSFPLARSGEGLLVFENLQHDFPQRVIYKLAAPGKLAARIEGARNGQVRGVDFPMTRC